MLRLWHCGIGFIVAITACSGNSPATEHHLEQGGDGGAWTSSTAEGGTAAVPSTGGNAGVGVVAGAAGQAPVPFGPLGLSCVVSTACAAGLDCFAVAGTDFGTLSPAEGFCSKRCTTDVECQAIDSSARCADLIVDAGLPPKICVPSCTLGDNRACGGRDDLACWPLDGSDATLSNRACIPTCNDDIQCPAGKVCDRYFNLCSSVAPAGGLELGSECDPSAAVNSCAEGFCIELDGGGACTAYCRRGTFPQCGGNGEDSTCGWVFPGDEAAGAADIGMCAGTCACDAQCATGSHCVLHPDRAGMTKPGICTSGADVGIASCS